MAAVALTTIKNTNQETIIKFEGAAGSTDGTITIANLTAGTQVRNSDTPVVNIVKLISAGLLSSAVTIKRNSTVVMACAPENAPVINLTADGISDGVNNTSDIVVTVAGAVATGYIVLRKIAGWSTKVETAVYGAYDDETRVGASTTLSGSPDKV
jgi:hypothetical protein